MGGFKIALNTKKPGNYAFFCPSSRLHLTLSHPIALTDRVTSSIIQGIRFGKLIDVDGEVARYVNDLGEEQNSKPEQQMPDMFNDLEPEQPKKKAGRKTGKKKTTEQSDQLDIKDTDKPLE